MASIDPFLPGAFIAADVLAIMRDAFDRACKSLDEQGLPALVQEVVASRIIRMARAGERDPKALCEEALKGIGLHSDCERPAPPAPQAA